MAGKAFQIVRYKVGKDTFEVMTDIGSCQKYRKEQLGFDNTIQTDVIFTNQSKGEKANVAQLEAAFGTSDNTECIKKILEKGEIQLTTAERKEMQEKKKREIINYIHNYYIDPKTKKPHPVVRIEQAIETLKFNVDIDKSTDKQIQELVKKLTDVIPIRKCEMEGVLSIPHQYIGSTAGVLQQYCKVKSDKYDGTGCTMEISIVPGDFDNFMKELNRICKGDFQFNVIGDQGAQQTEDEEPKKGKRGGKAGGRGRGK